MAELSEQAQVAAHGFIEEIDRGVVFARMTDDEGDYILEFDLRKFGEDAQFAGVGHYVDLYIDKERPVLRLVRVKWTEDDIAQARAKARKVSELLNWCA